MQRYLFSSAITTSFTAIKEVQVLKKKTEREETDEELRKRFDEFVRETILTEGNKLPKRINFITSCYFAGVDIEDYYHLITVSNARQNY